MLPVQPSDEETSVFRVGYRPDPFAWTPWQYAANGHFDGRWDDPDGRFRTLYVADQLLGCLLEVLADFRPDLPLAAHLANIDDEDDEGYPTTRGGTVPKSWLTPRTVGQAIMSGQFSSTAARPATPTKPSTRLHALPRRQDPGLTPQGLTRRCTSQISW